MPASTLDPISTALKNAFHKSSGANGTNGVNGNGANLELGLLSSAKKTLMATTSVAFDPPVKHLGSSGGPGSGLSVLKKSGLIFLNPNSVKKKDGGQGQSNGVVNGEGDKKKDAGQNSVPEPPKPKVSF